MCKITLKKVNEILVVKEILTTDLYNKNYKNIKFVNLKENFI